MLFRDDHSPLDRHFVRTNRHDIRFPQDFHKIYNVEGPLTEEDEALFQKRAANVLAIVTGSTHRLALFSSRLQELCKRFL